MLGGRVIGCRRRLRQEGEEGARAGVVIVDGGDERPGSRAGHRPHEQTEFVVQSVAAPVENAGVRGRCAGAGRRYGIGQAPCLEQSAAQARIGPDAVLHTGDDDRLELGAQSRRRGEQRDKAWPIGCGQRVFRHLAVEDVADEGFGLLMRGALDEALGGVEQGDQGVEGSGGVTTAGLLGSSLPVPGERRTVERARPIPDAPEQLVDRLPGVGRRGRLGDRGGEACGGAGLRCIDEREVRGKRHRLPQQLGCRGRSAVGELHMPQACAQASEADSIQPAER